MKLHHTITAAAVALALAGLTANTMACSTVIVGKDVSSTGQIIVGHNEDNGGRMFSAQYWVPPQTHKKGEMIKFEESAAAIPQVEKTFGFYWTETIDPDGASFSDGFINENGVMVVSNACPGNFEDDMMPLKDGGVGYGIRRLIAERATSARDAVRIATELLNEYGYFSQGRTYTIADRNEAWQLAIHQGNTWVAHKVKDDEIVYVPNNFMMNKVDATDTEHWIVAPGTIQRAINNGRYKPAKPGVYNDFNFRVAVAPAEERSIEVNKNRNMLAWEYITGKKITDPEQFPYSVTPNRKFSVDDVKAMLRLHEKDIGDDPGWYHHKSTGLCRATTHESLIVEFTPEPLLTKGWRAIARPCETPYVPFYPLARPADGTAFMKWDKATAEHFKGIAENFSYRSSWPVMTYVEAANTIDYQRQDIKENDKFIAGLEKNWAEKRPGVELRAKVLLKVSPLKALSYLHQYNQTTFNEATAAVREHTTKIAPHHMNVLALSINPKSDALVDVVLYSDKTLDATKIVVDKTFCGAGRASVGNKTTMDMLAKPVKTEVKDVDGDGRMDLVLSFKQDALAFGMLHGMVYDTWLYTWYNGKRVTAFDSVFVEGEKEKSASNKVCNCFD